MASPDLVTVVPIGILPGHHVSGPTWASPGPGVSGTQLGSIRIWLHFSLTVTQPDLLSLVFTSPHMDMVTLVTTSVSPGHGESDPHLGLNVTGDSRFHVDIMWTCWLHCF